LDIGAAELHNYVVTTLEESPSPEDGATSLREAVDLANADSCLSFISFAVNGTVQLHTALPMIVRALEMAGPGPDRLPVSGSVGQDLALIHVGFGADLTLG